MPPEHPLAKNLREALSALMQAPKHSTAFYRAKSDVDRSLQDISAELLRDRQAVS